VKRVVMVLGLALAVVIGCLTAYTAFRSFVLGDNWPPAVLAAMLALTLTGAFVALLCLRSLRKQPLVWPVVGLVVSLVAVVATGAAVVSADHGNRGVIIVAAGAGDEATLKSVLDHDAGLVKVRDNMAWTPLHHAAFNGNHLASVAMLLDKGADPNATGGAPGEASLADMNAPVPRVGAPVKVRMRDGITPLMCAAMSRGTESAAIVQALLDKGADVNARSQNGRTALSIALALNNEEVEIILREHGAKE